MDGMHPTRTSPSEVTAEPGAAEHYYRLRASDHLEAPYSIPWQFLRGVRKDIPVDGSLETPLLVFINSRSGGRVGPKLERQLCRAVGRKQVFDLSQYKPDQVLAKVWENLRAQEAAGDPVVRQLRERLRILVAGGDGTITWVLTAIKDLALRPQPAVAIIPLGTGNDLSRTFGWGSEFLPKWIKGYNSTYCTLLRVAEARVEELDCWKLSITLPSADLLKMRPHCLYIAGPPKHTTAVHPADMAVNGARAAAGAPSVPPSVAPPLSQTAAANSSFAPSNAAQPGSAVSVVSASASVSPTNSISGSVGGPSQAAAPSTAPSMYAPSVALSVPEHPPEMAVAGAAVGPQTVPVRQGGGTHSTHIKGLFFNYFSIGLDAKAAHGFHNLRESKPYLTAGQLSNKFWYTWFSCATGWFCCARPLATKVSMEVQRPGSDRWEELRIPGNVRALVLLNLQSYAGGAHLWGDPHDTSTSTSAKGAGPGTKFREPSYHDGLLEVVGLTHGFTAATVVGSNGKLLHALRICQASGVRLSLKGASSREKYRSHCYMQVDGEPWMQDIPKHHEAEPITVEVSHGGTSRMLHNFSSLTEASPNPVALPGSGSALAAPGLKAPLASAPLHVVVAKPSTPSLAPTDGALESDIAQFGGSMRQSSFVSGSMRDVEMFSQQGTGTTSVQPPPTGDRSSVASTLPSITAGDGGGASAVETLAR